VTAGPDRSRVSPPAWFVTTDQGIVLAGPFRTRAEATRARTDVVERLRSGMQRERFTGEQIAARVRAVLVGYGVLTGPWQRFERTR
jgi:hypothetical protein